MSPYLVLKATDGELERRLCEEVRAQLRTRAPASGVWSLDEVRPVLREALGRLAPGHPDGDAIALRALQDLVGLGPLEELLADPEVQEVMVNGPADVFVEIEGLIRRHGRGFRDERHLAAVLERLMAMGGQSVHERRPFAEGTLPDGSRFHVVVPPMSARGPLLTLRRFPSRLLTMEELTGRFHALSPSLAAFLELAVRHRSTIVISGAAGTGKTTLMNALAAAISPDHRVVSLETAAELKLSLPNWAALECVRPGPDGGGGADLRELLRNALRMRPDRLLVGECLGSEAFDLLQALNTGHRGSMTTIHASSPWDALERLITLALSSGVGVPPPALWRQAAAGIDFVVQLERIPGGSRRVTGLARVARGSDGETSVKELGRLVLAAAAMRWECSVGPADLPACWPREEQEEALRLLRAG